VLTIYCPVPASTGGLPLAAVNPVDVDAGADTNGGFTGGFITAAGPFNPVAVIGAIAELPDGEVCEVTALLSLARKDDIRDSSCDESDGVDPPLSTAVLMSLEVVAVVGVDETESTGVDSCVAR